MVRFGSIPTDSDFNEAVEDIVGTKVIAGSNVTVAYNDTTGETTISSLGGSSDTELRLMDSELLDDYSYIGYEHETDGSWYIYRRTRDTNLREYASGSSDYLTNWTNRASLVYA